MSNPYVIVGAGMAGALAVETLREEGFEGEVVLIGEEPDRPYERPPLSKDYLRGETEAEKVFVHPSDFYESHQIELITGRTVVALDPASGTIGMDSGDTLGYERLLLATGAESRHLPLPGSDLDGIFHLRSRSDSDRLREALQQSQSVVVVGGGWIGSEVAASARGMGVEVSLVEGAATPLAGIAGSELGRFFLDLHASKGVDLHMETSVAGFVGDRTVEGVRTADGAVIPGDIVIVGAGAIPRLELAESGGLEVDGGFITDQFLETTVPGIYAAGDAAAAFHPLYDRHLRVEHWSNARHQGRVAARNMMGARVPYDRVPYFFSDQYDVGLEYSGHRGHGDELVIRGDLEKREFVALWTRDGVLTAGMNVNVWDVADGIQTLISSQSRVDSTELADPTVSFESLAGNSLVG